MITEEYARRFANCWISAWNAHDLDRVILHYQSVNNLLAAEVFELNAQGLATRVQCHYYQA